MVPYKFAYHILAIPMQPPSLNELWEGRFPDEGLRESPVNTDHGTEFSGDISLEIAPIERDGQGDSIIVDLEQDYNE